MTQIEFAAEVLDDFDRILDHLKVHDVENATARINEIVDAINILDHSPLIGRPIDRLDATGTRELIIGRDSHGYIALYRHVPELAVVFILAIRSQKEAGYARP